MSSGNKGLEAWRSAALILARMPLEEISRKAHTLVAFAKFRRLKKKRESKMMDVAAVSFPTQDGENSAGNPHHHG